MPKYKYDIHPSVKSVRDAYGKLYSESSERRSQYDINKEWFEGVMGRMYPDNRPDWKASVLANLIESNIRTLVAVLTDSKPIMRVIGVPFKKIDEAVLEEMSTMSQAIDNGLNHVWRINDMHKKMRKIVLEGSLSGMLASRVYWDSSMYNGLGEIKIAPVHPRHIFFDKDVTELNIEDGSCPWFIYAIPQPLTWFQYYWPDKKVKQYVPDKEDPNPEMPMGLYLEAYKADSEIEVKKAVGDGVVSQSRNPKYPKGRRIIVGTDTLLDDSPIEVFPFAVEPISDQSETLYGADDVQRQIQLQIELNLKLSQISQNIALSGARQAVMDDKCGIDTETFAQESGKTGALFLLEGGKTIDDFNKHFKILDTPTFNHELFQYPYLVKEFMETVTGVTRLVQGLPAKRERQTGFEIGKMLETATIRLRERAAHVESFIRQMGLITLNLMKMNYTEPRDLWSIDQETNQLQANTFEYPTEENPITGEKMPVNYEFDVIVQPDTTLPIDLQSQADLAMRLKEMQVISNAEVLQRVHYPNPKAALPDQPPPGQQGGAAGPPPPPMMA